MINAARPDRTWLLWIGLLVFAQAADLVTTAASLNLGGREANPLVLGIVSSGGMNNYVFVKLASTILVIALLSLAGWLGRRLPGDTSAKVGRTLLLGLQVGVGIQILAALVNLLVVGGR